MHDQQTLPINALPARDAGPRSSRLGVWRAGAETDVLLWAPKLKQVELLVEGKPVAGKTIAGSAKAWALQRREDGYFHGRLPALDAGTRYWFAFDGKRRPDPASRLQPLGPHGPSELVDLGSFSWRDQNWRGIPLRDLIFYELHVGTFTPQGTFEAVIAKLDELRELGITAIEVMPIAQFPGVRNWGYDGVHPFAAQNSYGGALEFCKLVDACHQRELAVILDVVYNHLGPEGNYLGEYAPYFTSRYSTPWGPGINFDGPGSDEVRRYFAENALYWLQDCHVDGLRLDAIHGIVDPSARPFLAELAAQVNELEGKVGRALHLIAESDLNDPRVIRSREDGGYGLAAQWNDDYHHAVHVALSGDRTGIYGDFEGADDIARALRQGFVYTGQRSPYRQRRHGAHWPGLRPDHLVVFLENHDQVGNRVGGRRLSQMVGPERLRLGAALMLLSPFLPLVFMGEEWGADTPFYYFVDHSDAELREAVRRGRAEEFAHLGAAESAPDPSSEQAFTQSKLRWQELQLPEHNKLWACYRELLRLRKQLPALIEADFAHSTVGVEHGVLRLLRWTASEGGQHRGLLLANISAEHQLANDQAVSGWPKAWECVFDSCDPRWGSSGPAGAGSGGPLDQAPPPADTTAQLASNPLERRPGAPLDMQIRLQPWQCQLLVSPRQR